MRTPPPWPPQPSNQTMLAGIKPTVGRVSRYGVIPIAADQDTPGPMARTVSDAAILLQGLDIPARLHERTMAELQGGQKVRVLLAQALFGRPEALRTAPPSLAEGHRSPRREDG